MIILLNRDDLIIKLLEAGLEEKQALLIIDLATQPPAKASEIGKRLGISRMDAYNSLKKLQEKAYNNYLQFKLKIILKYPN